MKSSEQLWYPGKLSPESQEFYWDRRIKKAMSTMRRRHKEKMEEFIWVNNIVRSYAQSKGIDMQASPGTV